jgi:hypothetical protein
VRGKDEKDESAARGEKMKKDESAAREKWMKICIFVLVKNRRL